MSTPMVEKFATLWPEITMLIGGTACLFTGLAKTAAIRQGTVWLAGLTLFVAAGIDVTMAAGTEAAVSKHADMAHFVKLATCGIGFVLLLVAAGVPGQLKQTRDAERAGQFEPGDVMRGEFYAFFLFSLTGVMLTAAADDLVWLFLALELTSLPTYVMVATSRDKIHAQESAVKYFFLGALAAAVFLYGFAMIYGATGFTSFDGIRAVIAEQGTGGRLSPLLLIGMVLAVVGVCFKIAAVPMHFYAADVYEGAATPVTAFLAFVPKTAGFVALILLLELVGWTYGATGQELPPVLTWLVWGIAAATMTVGNVLALVQRSVKRVLAYSSVAHSGYIMVGLLAGLGAGAQVIGDGIAAILFYLVAYGLATVGAFAVLALLENNGEEANTYDDISGLARRHPLLGALMLVCVLSLLGMPPLVGFLGKIYLFGSAVDAGFLGIVIVGVVNSAISAGYYLRIAAVCFFGSTSPDVKAIPLPGRLTGAVLASFASVVFGLFGGGLIDRSHDATEQIVPPMVEDSTPMLEARVQAD